MSLKSLQGRWRSSPTCPFVTGATKLFYLFFYSVPAQSPVAVLSPRTSSSQLGDLNTSGPKKVTFHGFKEHAEEQPYEVWLTQAHFPFTPGA